MKLSKFVAVAGELKTEYRIYSYVNDDELIDIERVKSDGFFNDVYYQLCLGDKIAVFDHTGILVWLEVSYCDKGIVKTTEITTGGGSASDITFNPAGLKVLKGTNVQSALSETDNALADLQDSVSILATSVQLANTIGADTVIMLDELAAMEIDGRPSYKLPGATVYAPNGQQGIIHSVDTDAQTAIVKTTVIKQVSGAGTNAGIKGDYMATWGWMEGDNGLPTIVSGSNNIKTPASIVMMCPGADGYITFTGEMTYENELTEDFTLFYARNTDGTGATLVGVTDVVWSDTEPEPNGQSGFQAWKKSGSSNWQLRSNDTGNTWREVVGGPIADVHYTDGTVTRLDFDGYRQFNKQQYVKFASGSGTALQEWIPVMKPTTPNKTNFSIGGERLIIDTAVGQLWGSTEKSIVSMGAVATAFKTPLSHTNSNTNLGCSMADLEKAVPTPPTTAGNYVLKATVAEDGTVSTQWVKEA